MYDGQAKDPLTAGLSALGEVNPEAAREMVDKILDEDRENVNSAFRARSIVQDAYAKSPDKTSVILESYAPWRDVLPETEAEYVLYETRGQYNIQCVPKNLAGNETKVKLPEEWLTEKPEGCKFVAPARHVCGFDTMEHAKAALDEILKDRTAQIEASKWENQKSGLSSDLQQHKRKHRFPRLYRTARLLVWKRPGKRRKCCSDRGWKFLSLY